MKSQRFTFHHAIRSNHPFYGRHVFLHDQISGKTERWRMSITRKAHACVNCRTTIPARTLIRGRESNGSITGHMCLTCVDALCEGYV